MWIHYDPDADILTVLLSDEPPQEAVEEPGGVVVSYGKDDHPVSVEFLQASSHHLVEGGRVQVSVDPPA